MSKAIVLLSGGLDSAVSIAIAKKKRVNISLAIIFDYGQRAVKQEIKASRKLAKHFKVKHRVIKLDWFKSIVDNKTVPLVKKSDLKFAKRMRHASGLAWVPNRNGVFVSIAAAFAESLKANFVITGFNREEAKTFPDNSVQFVKSVNQVLRIGTKNKVKLVSFVIGMNKKQIVNKAKSLKVPLGFTWSCYKGNKNPCGKCESCVRLK